MEILQAQEEVVGPHLGTVPSNLTQTEPVQRVSRIDWLQAIVNYSRKVGRGWGIAEASDRLPKRGLGCHSSTKFVFRLQEVNN